MALEAWKREERIDGTFTGGIGTLETLDDISVRQTFLTFSRDRPRVGSPWPLA